MLLSISTTRAPATDLGFLLHKHPDKVQAFDTGVGTARIFYPEATDTACTACLLLEVDPIALMRGQGTTISHYINDRAYTASSLMSVAMGKTFRTAMKGDCTQRPELTEEVFPLTITIAPVRCRGGLEGAQRLFEPLGWAVSAQAGPLDERFPEWGDASHMVLTLSGHFRLKEALTHLYVLIPVLDGDQHYHVGDAEVEKLLRYGEGWLDAHPQKDLILRRYLKNRRSLVSAASEELILDAPPGAGVESDDVPPAPTAPDEVFIPLNVQRMTRVVEALKASGAKSIADLGCGQGALLKHLIAERQFEKIIGVDVTIRALETASRRLNLEQMSPAARDRITLIQGALTYRDARIRGVDAVALVEVIEHVDPERLPALASVVFGDVGARTIVVTTPNREYNALYPGLEENQFRHGDHRFEWTRAEFHDWVTHIQNTFGYGAEISIIGDIDPNKGAPTQMAVFTKR